MAHFTAAVSNASGPIWYRFDAGEIGRQSHIVKDFGLDNTLDWTTISHEGVFAIQVTARELSTGQTAMATRSFELQDLVTDQPVITPTAHPLVFIYSAPPCGAGQRMRVRYQSAEGPAQSTPFRACQPDVSLNFYLAGLQPQTEYSVRHSIESGGNSDTGPILNLRTQDAPSGLPVPSAVQMMRPPLRLGVLLQAPIGSPQVATDLTGNLLWYYPGTVSYITRPEPGGRFFAMVQNATADRTHQLVREFDLVGMTVLETNAARVSEQLVALGRRPITSFHHEARRLPDGNILVLAGVEQIMTDVQGAGDVDVLGDMIVVLDSNLNVVWTWDTFDHLDLTRQSTSHDVCPGGCAAYYLAPNANDWVHGNSVQLTPDGNLLYSSRHQDWLIKIDYQNGAGTGDVLWRLGREGDFLMDSADRSPWFSHQHDPQFLPDNTTIVLFDNGNLRHVDDPSSSSRGQVIQLDQQNRVARLATNVDLGVYAMALGAAQRLPGGNTFFLAGWLPDGTSMAMETDPTGQIVYALKVQALEYRAFRMVSLYTPD
jgi:hypothetical protein